MMIFYKLNIFHKNSYFFMIFQIISKKCHLHDRQCARDGDDVQLHFLYYSYNFYQDIMFSGGIRRGLHIDDDDEPKEKYEYQGLDANRKKGNFEKDLDAMLFGGGFGAPPPRRRPASQSKPTEQGKPAEQAKPAETQKTQPAANVPSTPSKPAQPNNAPASQSPPKETENKSIVKPTGNVGNNVNKSTDSGKNQPQSKTQNQTNTININSNANKVVVNETSESIVIHKKDIKIVVQTPPPPVQSISNKIQPLIPPNKKYETSGTPKVQKIEAIKPQRQKIEAMRQQESKVEERKPSPPKAVPSQPTKVEQPEFLNILHPFSAKNLFHKPGPIRKLKKQAEDYKFAEENVALTTSVDVVRPFETDRNRQKKLNDVDFKDFQFPSSSSSLGGEHKTKESVWKRQSQLAKNVTFGKYVDPNDINAGHLSSPHFVSTLTAIAENQANTKRLIEDQKANSNGFYLIRLFVNSVWRYVVVDSSLPFVDGEHAGVVSNPDSEFQLAPALIEKAYAKSFGGYDTFSRVQPRQYYLRDLTGAPVKKYSIDNSDVGNIIRKAIASGNIVVAVPNEKIASIGLNPNFSYTVLNYSAKGSLQLRNSFGTLEEKSKVSIKAEGNFELGAAQVKDFISHILVTTLNTAYSTSTIQSRHRQGFYSSYNFKIRKDTHGFLSISQWDQRLFPQNSGYEYSPFHIVLHKVEEEGHATFVNAAFTLNGRNLDLEVNLAPGTYTAFVSANWRHAEYAYNLTFYGSERVDFERVYTEKVPNLISQSLQEINVHNGKRTDLNKNSCQYFHYHPQSNLVILTVENTSERDATVTADLSKVKFDHLVLLTSHNNEDNYSNKVGAEIEEYKQIPLADRRWSVSLAGGHRFTWILATDLPYSEANPKSWGFN